MSNSKSNARDKDSSWLPRFEQEMVSLPLRACSYPYSRVPTISSATLYRNQKILNASPPMNISAHKTPRSRFRTQNSGIECKEWIVVILILMRCASTLTENHMTQLSIPSLVSLWGNTEDLLWFLLYQILPYRSSSTQAVSFHNYCFGGVQPQLATTPSEMFLQYQEKA